MNKNLLAALAVVAASSTAVAFEGFYGGAAVGYDWSKINTADSTDQGDFKLKGASVDLLGGYNFPISDEVFLGPDVAIGYTWAKKSLGGETVKSTWHGNLAARLGFAVSNDVLLFVKAGGDYRQFKAEGGAVATTKKNKLGWLAGVGAEYKFDENISVRGEYNYSRYSLGNDFVQNDSKINYQRAVLGVAWYF